MKVRTMKTALATFLAFMVSFPTFTPRAVASDEKLPEYDPDRVLVAFKPNTPEALRAAAHSAEHSQVETQLDWRNLDVVRLPSGQDPITVAARYERNPNVAYAEPNWRVELLNTSDDPQFVDEWGLQNIGQTVTSGVAGIPDADIDAPEGWKDAYGVGNFPSTGGVRVGVLDSGIDKAHPDLLGKTKVCASAMSANGTVVTGQCSDDNGHGTHVAGTIGAVTNNGIGVAGVAPNAELAVFKFLDSRGSGWTADAVAGIHWLRTEGGARVINMSFRSPSSLTLDLELRQAHLFGTLLVAAAGNNGCSSLNPCGVYPALHPDVVSVAANDQADQRAFFSNCNSDVELSAPGVSVWSTWPGQSYRMLHGTSMAAPHVAGVAAVLMWKKGTDAAKTRSLLTSTADDIGSPESDLCSGFGRINLHGALSEAGPYPIINSVEGDSTSPAYGSDTTPSVEVTRVSEGDTVALFDRGVLAGSKSVPPGSSSVTFNAGETDTDVTVSGEGNTRLTSMATYYSGRESAMSAPFLYGIETTPPGVPTHIYPAADQTVNYSTPTFYWTKVTDPSKVTYRFQLDDSGSTFASPEVDRHGLTSPSFTPTSPLADSTYHWRVRAIDEAGNAGDWSTPSRLFLDATAPPSPSTPDLLPEFDSGTSNTDNVTNQIPIFTGTAEPNSLVMLKREGIDSVNQYADDKGVWTINSGWWLADGVHSWRARSADAGGNLSEWSGEIAVTIDTTAPAVVELLSPQNWGTLNDNTPTFDWTDVIEPSGITYQIQLDKSGWPYDSPEVDESGIQVSTFTPTTPIPDGTYYWRVRAIDQAGNGAWSSVHRLTIDSNLDTTPPPSPSTPDLLPEFDSGTSNTDNVTNHRPVFTGTAEPNSLVMLKREGIDPVGRYADGNGVWTIDSGWWLADGVYSWRARSADAAGNLSDWSGEITVTIDTTAPAVVELLSPQNWGTVTDNTPTFDWTDVIEPSGITYQIQLDNSGWPYDSPEVDESGIQLSTFTPATPIPDGTYYWRVRAIDQAGNGAWSPVYRLTIDANAPLPPSDPDLEYPSDSGTSNTDNLTNDNTPTFVGTAESQSTIRIFVDGVLRAAAPASVEGTYNITTPTLPDGTRSVSATATDRAGNESLASGTLVVTIETGSPSTPSPLSPTNGSDTIDATPTFDWSDSSDASGLTYQIEIDNSGSTFPSPEVNESGLPTSTFTPTNPLAPGTYSWRVQATDAAGNVGVWSAVFTATIKTPPGSIVGKVTSQTTKQGIAGATVNCGIAGSATTASDGTYWLSSVAPGSHTCSASASGHKSLSKTVTVSSGTTTTANFALRKA